MRDGGSKTEKRDGIKSSQQGGTCEREKRVRNIHTNFEINESVTELNEVGGESQKSGQENEPWKEE